VRTRIAEQVQKLQGEHLVVHSFFLLVNSVILALGGFAFWIINTRLFTAEEIGIGSTLISLISLFLAFSSLGFNTALLRYLPQSHSKNRLVNTCFVLSAATMILISGLYLIFADVFTPALGFVNNSILLVVAFLLFAAFASVFSLSESVFIAERKSQYVLTKNLLSTVLKLGLPFFLVFGGFGIFSAFGISVIISSLLAIFLMRYKIQFSVDWQLLKDLFRFSAGNYAASLIVMLPFFGLPVFVTNFIGVEQTAYFYIPWMISMALFLIPQSVSKVLLSEGSHTREQRLLRKAFLFNFLILVPAVIILLLIGPYLLGVFGQEYVENSLPLLQMLLLSSLLFSIPSIMSMYYNIEHRLKTVIGIQILIAVPTFVLAYLFLDQGIFGVGLAWTLANILTVLAILVLKK